MPRRQPLNGGVVADLIDIALALQGLGKPHQQPLNEDLGTESTLAPIPTASSPELVCEVAAQDDANTLAAIDRPRRG